MVGKIHSELKTAHDVPSYLGIGVGEESIEWGPVPHFGKNLWIESE